MELWQYPLIVIAGIAAGFINTLAGSGSLITLSLLLFLGVPADIANGSNRVGVLFQTLTSAARFEREKALDWRGGIILALPAIVGSLLGAQIAVSLDENLMRQVIGAVMLIMLVVILIRPKRWLEGEREFFSARPSSFQLLIFFLIGIYGGFIQAGVGIFLLGGLVLSAGYNLVRANAVKTLIVLIFTIAALIIFIRNGQVRWDIGIPLAAGNALGGWLAAKTALERGAVFVRYILIGVVAFSALWQLGIIQRLLG